jgi:UDP-3-O-[3-hydroxymyristoyl] glucosamine N-acyltransferase
MTGVVLFQQPLSALAARYGGVVRGGANGSVNCAAPVVEAGAGVLAPLFSLRYLDAADAALERGALLLIDGKVARQGRAAQLPGWVHPHASWVLASLLEDAIAPAFEPVFGEDTRVGAGAVVLPRVRVGARVTIGPGAVIGDVGCGWASGPDGHVRRIPHLGGVVIEDDVHIGALCTIASGTLGPTRIRTGVKLDAQVHIAHNCDIGAHTVIAAQSGLAGSVIVGTGVRMGGQVGVADHVEIGNGARIAAKSGVISDVPEGATFAGYPAVLRGKWLRGLAELYRKGRVPVAGGA